MEIVAEPVELQDVVVEEAPDAPETETAVDAPKAQGQGQGAEAQGAEAQGGAQGQSPQARARGPRARGPRARGPRARGPRARGPAPVAPAPAPKARARKPAAPAAPAPASIEDVMGMLAAALADQRQTRTAQRQEMYRGFLA